MRYVLLDRITELKHGELARGLKCVSLAVESFTRALAVELAPCGIRVNAVAPGIVETAMTEELRALAPEELLKRVLMKRLGKPEEIARVIAFLAGDEASLVTGQVWNVDGGFKLE